MNKTGKILVVDDEENVRKVLSTALEDDGYFVDTAETGEEAIEKSEVNFYNLALVDIRLPDMEGTKLLTAMKQTTPKMIMIIVTGYPTLQNAIEAVNKGADGYVTKPVDIGNLLKIVKKHLKRQQEAREYTEEKVGQFIETRIRDLEARAHQY